MQQPTLSANWKAPFFTVWVGQAFSLFGSSLVQFALVWWLTQKTQSATVLALATLIALLPQIVLGPVAGALVDRWNRRRVMIVADSSIALATLVLIYLFASGVVQVWHVYAILLVRALGGTFHSPAMQASTSLMVPEQHLSRVSGLNQALQQGAMSIVAPPAGALLLTLLPMQGILAIDIVTAVLGVAPLFFVHIPQPPRRAPVAGEAAPSLRREMGDGFRYVRAWPGLLAISLMAVAINFLLNPAGSLMPILVTRHFGGGAGELASLESAFGIGVLAGGLLLGVWGGFRRRVLTSLMGLIGLGAGFLIMGLAPQPTFGLALGGAFISGFMIPLTNGPLFAVLQAIVAPDMQGRVFTLLGSMAAAASPLGLVIAGPVADALGVQVWYVVGGITCALMGVLGFFIPVVVHLEDRNGQPEGNALPAVEVPAGVPAGKS